MQAYKRLLNYVKYPTTSDPESPTCPSTSTQTVLAMALVDEMKEIGISDVYIDDNSYVYGNIPASEGYENKPKIGFIAHMDVSDACSAVNVKPSIINYEGGDIVLNEKQNIVISEKQYPDLKNYKGKNLIVTDGTTLLGADDKCGIAEILTAAESVLNSDVKHGKINICFTPDEEIGRGPDKFDYERFDSDFAYTADGDVFASIEYENFNAASAKITIKGIAAHPGQAKGIMINASLVAMEFNSYLPKMEVPENTEGKQGYYYLTSITSNTSECVMSYILRDFDSDNIKNRVENLYKIADEINQKYEKEICFVESKFEYKNMVEIIKKNYHLIESAEAAIRMAGGNPFSNPVRGGTDGCELSYHGLPCPNLGTGSNNFHSIYEYCCIEDMDKCVDVIKNIIKIYSEK